LGGTDGVIVLAGRAARGVADAYSTTCNVEGEDDEAHLHTVESALAEADRLDGHHVDEDVDERPTLGQRLAERVAELGHLVDELEHIDAQHDVVDGEQAAEVRLHARAHLRHARDGGR